MSIKLASIKIAMPADMTKAEEKLWKETEKEIKKQYDPEKDPEIFYGTVTKVLAKPGIRNDEASKFMGTRNSGRTFEVLCQAVSRPSPGTYLNKQCFYEATNDLQPATEQDKIKFRKTKSF